MTKQKLIETFYNNHQEMIDFVNSLTDEQFTRSSVGKWTVAPWNEGGQRFYEKLGAIENTEWLNYEWNI